MTWAAMEQSVADGVWLKLAVEVQGTCKAPP